MKCMRWRNCGRGRSTGVRMVMDWFVMTVWFVFVLRKERPFSWMDCPHQESLSLHNW